MPIDMQHIIYLFFFNIFCNVIHAFSSKNQNIYPGPTDTGKRSITRKHSC